MQYKIITTTIIEVTDIFRIDGLNSFKNNYVDGKYTKVINISTYGKDKVATCINKNGIVELIDTVYIKGMTEDIISRYERDYITY